MSAYGQDGIEKMVEILRAELEMVMRLCGCPTLAHIKPGMVNARSLDRHSESAPIPPSPYAYQAPAYKTRSAPMPEELDKAGIQVWRGGRRSNSRTRGFGQWPLAAG